MSVLCEYEQLRLNNIREREALFDSLEINKDKSSLSTRTEEARPRRVKQKKENQEPVRKSARLAGGPVVAAVETVAGVAAGARRPRRERPENCNDYLHATRTFTGAESPAGLQAVATDRYDGVTSYTLR